ncbi:MAG: hypothetical protein VB067_09620, partial [Christensenellaceae bacterium]|nr:hypothetical protein [Christensenellaceae bacterium]
MVPTGPVVRRRLALLTATFFVLFCLLSWQLFFLQVLSSRALQARAQSQWTQESMIQPSRGTIYDRSGRTLAISATAYAASVSPRQVADAALFARL